MLNLKYRENGLSLGVLSLSKTRRLNHLKADPKIVSIVQQDSADRQEVEQFIIDTYKNAYGAQIKVHYPILMSIRNAQGEILAATGFRPASKGSLFLEQYLDAPVEEVLKTSREKIVEIGNLASKGGGASLFLFAALAAYLNYNGFEQAVVTSTDFLQKRFAQMGLKPKKHAKADPDLLLNDDEYWGTYYNTHPHILSGSVLHGYKRLQSQLGAEYHAQKPKLFPRLHYKIEEV